MDIDGGVVLNAEPCFNVENPLHADNIPVAELVIIEVDAQPVLEPKQRTLYEACEKIWEYIQLAAALIILLGLLGGVILFMVWGFNPFVFGPINDDN
jgi:hypothetical protein